MTDKSSEHPISPDTEQFISERPEVKVVHVPRIGEQPKSNAVFAEDSGKLLRYTPNPTTPLPGAINDETFDAFVLRLYDLTTRGKTSWLVEDLKSFARRYSSHVNSGLLEKLALIEDSHEDAEAAYEQLGLADYEGEDGLAEHIRRLQERNVKFMEQVHYTRQRALAAEARISVLERERDEALEAQHEAVHNELGAESQLSTLREALNRAHDNIGFLSSVIKSGERWSVTCQEALDQTHDDIRALTPPTEPQGETK